MSSPPLRAFELVPAIQRIQTAEVGEKIETLELSGDSLYVGTSAGRLQRHRLEEKRDHAGRIVFVASKIAEREIGQKNASVTFVRSASALDRLMVLCDGVLSVLSMSDLFTLTLAGASKLRGVTACCVNENPTTDDPFAVQMCLAKKKQVAVINISEEKLVVGRIRDLSSQVLEVCMDGVFVCAALDSHYVVFDMGATAAPQDLFPVPEDSPPVVARVAKEEFLLSAPGGLGMFVTCAGVSERPPIQWGKPVNKFVLCAPYIVAMGHEGITVYSILDQQQKQSLHFGGGRIVGNFDGRLLVASASSVYCILPIPVETQIQALLESGHVSEALELAENARESGRDDFQRLLHNVRVRAGFVCLKNCELDRAKELFIKGMVDPRELISLYPRLLPSSSNFVRAVPALHELADVDTSVAKGDSQKKERLDVFLVEMLELMRNEESNKPYQLEVDTALLKLLARVDSQKVISLLTDSELVCDYDDCQSSLQSLKMFHPLAELHFRHGHFDAALSLWSSILRGDNQDDNFPGLDFFTRRLMSSPEELIWRYSEFVLDRDQDLGVSLFTREGKFLHEEDGVMEREEKVVNFLHKYPDAHLKYLEHLVWEREAQVEKFHTRLATAYLEQVEKKPDLKSKFQTLIIKSTLIKASFLLSRLERKADMEQEKAILYGKMGDHNKALKTLVLNISNLKAAERYCEEMSAGKNLTFRQSLFRTLLKIYLDPSPQSPHEFEAAARALFNRRSRDLGAKETLEILPQTWSLASIERGITSLIAGNEHKFRSSQIQSALSKSDNVNAKLERYLATSGRISVAVSSYCMVCRKQFSGPEFLRFPNGIMTHAECAGDDRGVCPVTGKIFSAT